METWQSRMHARGCRGTRGVGWAVTVRTGGDPDDDRNDDDSEVRADGHVTVIGAVEPGHDRLRLAPPCGPPCFHPKGNGGQRGSSSGHTRKIGLLTCGNVEPTPGFDSNREPTDYKSLPVGDVT